MLGYLIKHKFIFAGIVAGATLGYLYYYFIGCANGTCIITSKPVNSTMYGALLGGLLVNILTKEK